MKAKTLIKKFGVGLLAAYLVNYGVNGFLAIKYDKMYREYPSVRDYETELSKLDDKRRFLNSGLFHISETSNALNSAFSFLVSQSLTNQLDKINELGLYSVLGERSSILNAEIEKINIEKQCLIETQEKTDEYKLELKSGLYLRRAFNPFYKMF